MELLVTLRKIEMLEKIAPLADGVIAGSRFTSSYNLSLDQLEYIKDYCNKHDRRFYIVMDDFISEDDLSLLDDYLSFIKKLDVDGIYFHDLGIYSYAQKYDLVSRLIYDGKTVLCNSLDSAFFLEKGIDSVMISRELTLEEIKEIVNNLPGKVNLQIFGHLRLSYSKRKFLKNYFRQIDKEYDYLNSETLHLVEEKRDYSLPIIENEHGTYIYSDYVFEMFNEICDLKDKISRGVVDSLFVDDNIVMQVCRDYRRISNENKDFLRHNLIHNYPENYSSAYLYQRTNITKDEQD